MGKSIGRGLAKNFWVALCYWLLAILVRDFFARYGLFPAPIWPSASVALVAALMWRREVYPGIFAGSLLANVLLFQSPLGAACAISVTNTLGPGVAAWLIHRYAGTIAPFHRLWEVFCFLVFGVLLHGAVVATGGTAVMLLSGGLAAGEMTEAWLRWLISDGSGALLFAPAILLWIDPTGRMGLERRDEWLIPVAAVGTLGLTALVFFDVAKAANTYHGLAYLLVVPLTWATIRLSPLIGTTLLSAVAVASVAATVAGMGPFNGAGATRPLENVALMLVSLCTSVFISGALRSEQRRYERALEEANTTLESRIAARTADLNHAQSTLRSTFDAVHDAVLVNDHSGNIVEVNGKMLTLFELERSEAIGRPFATLSSPDHDAGAFAARWEGALRGEEQHFEWIAQRPGSGAPFPADVVLRLLRLEGSPHVIATVRDITDLKRAEATMREREELFRTMAELAPFGLVLTRPDDGRVVYANPTALNLFDVDEEGLAHHLSMGFYCEDGDRERLLRQLRERGSLQGVEVRFRNASGTPFWAQTSAAFATFKGEPVVVGGIVDITERKRHEEELRRARREAEDANAAKSRFLANVSHEIRTPLNAVVGLAHLLEMTRLTPTQREHVDVLRHAADTLLGVVNDILDLSKIEEGKLAVEAIPFRLDEVLERVVRMAGVVSREKRLEVVVDRDPVIPARLIGDPLRLGQVLLNLVANGIKFTDAGRVVLSVETAFCTAEKVAIRFTVSDTGIGMDGAQLERIFEAFGQADPSIARRFGGTGLGLAISRRLVALMGGELHAESEPGIGSSFQFSLALTAIPDDISAAPSPLSRGHALVVEYRPATRRALVRTLRGEGMTVVEASSHHAALALHEPFDLMVLAWPPHPGDAYPQEWKRETSPVVVLGSDNDELAGAPFARQATLRCPCSPLGLIEAATQLLTGASRHVAPREPLLLGRRLLLVEDNRVNQQVGRAVLEAAGAQVTVAGDGHEALAWLGSEPETFDAVLMDLQMPGLDGFAAVRAIREELGLRVPVIATTASYLGNDLAVEAGFDAAISKPIDITALMNTLSRSVERGYSSPGQTTGAAVPHRLPPLNLLLGEAPQPQSPLARWLRAKGHSVTSAPCGELSRQLSDHPFDLILLACDNEREILERAAEIRRLGRASQRSLPIIALLERVTKAASEAAMAAGCDAVVEKGPDGRLIEVMEALLGLDDEEGAPAPISPIDETRWSLSLAPLQSSERRAVIARSRADLREQLDQIESALAEGRLERVAEVAHRLSGVASILGLVAVHRVAARIESMEALHSPELLVAAVQQLRSALMEALVLLEERQRLDEESYSTGTASR